MVCGLGTLEGLDLIVSALGSRPFCRSCGKTSLETVIDLGPMPLANTYPKTTDALDQETVLPLIAMRCLDCHLMQLGYDVDPAQVFEEYAYFSSWSETWLDHAAAFAASQMPELNKGSLVVEVASNDGYLLKNFAERGVSVLGIEPAANVARAAESNGVRTVSRFLGETVAMEIADEFGLADLVVANNVIAHVPDLNDFLLGLRNLVSPTGKITIEFPHLCSTLEKNQFDTIYHEHYSYFSLLSLEIAARSNGLSVLDVEEIPTHGGSLRVTACRSRRGLSESARVGKLIRREIERGVTDPATYAKFSAAAERCRKEALDFLSEHARDVVVAYGAAAKGSTFLNYCQLSTDDVRVVADRSPYKQGRLMPGSHIPIVSPEEALGHDPDYLLILAWNLADEVVRQIAPLASDATRFVTAIPALRVFK